MGDFAINIKGVGSHHNRVASDVEQMAHKFVADLKAAGHSIVHASTTTGGALDHLHSQPMPIKDDTATG